jgi:hypothetical protein
MLFYIMLFAMTQTEQRQNQWFDSFIIYLVIEILIISSMIVLVTHVIVPGMAMKDVNNLKVRLHENMLEFRRKLRVQQKEKQRAEIERESSKRSGSNSRREEEEEEEEEAGERSIGRSQFSIRRTPSTPTTTVATATATTSDTVSDGSPEDFNASKYLFASTKLAMRYPAVREASLILQFRCV